MSGVYLSSLLMELGFTGSAGIRASSVTTEVGYLDVDPGIIQVHAVQLSTGSSWNTDLEATRLHNERDEFLSLHDTPPTYTGSAGKLATVNDDEDALVFEDGVTTFLGLSDTPSSYAGQATKYVRVNTGSTALEFFDAPGGAGAGVVGVLVHDEGVFLGTGTVINVVGQNISMSLSGSVAKIEQDPLSVASETAFTVRTTGTLSFTTNSTWEQIKYTSGTITVDRACDLICEWSGRWWGTTAKWEYCQFQFELDGTRTGRIWVQQKNAGPANSQTWWVHFQEVFSVASGTHGISVWTYDGASSLDRSVTAGRTVVRAPLGGTIEV